MKSKESFPETDEIERVRRHVERVRERIRELEAPDRDVKRETGQTVRL